MGVLLLVWILSGTGFGVGVAYIVDRLTEKNGTSEWNDIIFKFITFLTLIGYTVLGLLYTADVQHYWIYMVTLVVLGIGNLGGFGVIFLSFNYGHRIISPMDFHHSSL